MKKNAPKKAISTNSEIDWDEVSANETPDAATAEGTMPSVIDPDEVKKQEEICCAEIEESIATFKKHLKNSLDSIVCAAKTYFNAVNKYPELAEEAYSSAFPHVSMISWELLRRIGAGDLAPTAFFIGNEKTVSIVGRLDINTQNVLLGTASTPPVPQKVVADSGIIITRTVEEMTSSQLRRLIDSEDGHIRSVEEQRKLITPCDVKPYTPGVNLPYKVYKNSVVFVRRCELGIKELKDLIAKVEEKANANGQDIEEQSPSKECGEDAHNEEEKQIKS